MTSSTTALPQLGTGGDSYLYWITVVTSLVKSKKVDKCLPVSADKKKYDVTKPPDFTSTTEEQYHEVYARVLTGVHPDLFSALPHAATLHGLLFDLDERFSANRPALLFALKNKFTATRADDVGGDVRKFLDTLDAVAAQIKSSGGTIDDDLYCQTILSGLPSHLAHVRDDLITRSAIDNAAPTLTQIRNVVLAIPQSSASSASSTATPQSLLAFNKTHSNASNRSHSTNNYHGGQHNRPSNTKFCNYCHRKSHTEATCFHKHPHLAPSDWKPQPPAKSSGPKPGNLMTLIASHIPSIPSIPPTSIIFDTGASLHVCNPSFEQYMFDIRPCATSATTASGATVSISRVGSITFSSSIGTTFTINDMHILSDPASHTLLSGPLIQSRGYSYRTVGTSELHIFNTNKEHVFTARSSAPGLPAIIQAQPILPKAIMSVVDHHARFGHINDKYVDQTLTSTGSMSHPRTNAHTIDNCPACRTAKSTKQSFKPIEHRATHPNAIIHMDVVGPMPRSLGGANYFVLFTDDATTMRAAFPLAAKSQAFDKFIECRSTFEMMSGRPIQAVHSDNGGEFDSNQFNQYLRQAGIRVERSAPYEPQSNGRAERSNRTVLELIRANLHHACMPETFWAEALAYVIHTLNHTANAISPQSPLTSFTGLPRSVNHLRPFGCRAYAKVAPADKLSSRVKDLIMLGYDESITNYRLYDPSARTASIFRHVTFDETLFPYRTQHTTPANSTALTRPQFSPIFDPDHIDNAAAIQPHGLPNNPPAVPAFPLPAAPPPAVPHNNIVRIPDSPDSDEDDNNPPEQRRPNFFNIPPPNPAVGPPRASNHSNHYDRVHSGNILPPNNQRQRKPPQHMLQSFTNTEPDLSDTPTYKSAVSGPNASQWQAAIAREIESLRTKQTYTVVTLPPGAHAFNSKWVLKLKRDRDGNPLKFKARAVAMGNTQTEDEYDDTFGPVANIDTIRLAIAVATTRGWTIHLIDIVGAYLNAPADKDLYMRPPPGYADSSDPNRVWLLLKSIYGLRQSAYLWHQELLRALAEINFKPASMDQCLFVNDNASALVIVYVDDILIAGDEGTVSAIKSHLTKRFEATDSGAISFFLGIAFERTQTTTSMSQKAYIERLAHNFGVTQAKPAHTPLPAGHSLHAASKELEDNGRYRTLMGGLLFLSTRTRPDVAYAVSILTQRQQKPTVNNMNAAKHVLIYLFTTRALKLTYHATPKQQQTLAFFSDASWGDENIERFSISSYVVTYGGNLISFKCQKQKTVALSTVEAEFVSLAMTIQQAIWVLNLLSEMKERLHENAKVWCDNQGAITTALNPLRFMPRTKHISIKLKYVAESAKALPISIEYCETAQMLADFMTKQLPKRQMNENINKLKII